MSIHLVHGTHACVACVPKPGVHPNMVQTWQVLGVLIRVYSDMPTPDYIGLTRCQTHLGDAPATVREIRYTSRPGSIWVDLAWAPCVCASRVCLTRAVA